MLKFAKFIIANRTVSDIAVNLAMCTFIEREDGDPMFGGNSVIRFYFGVGTANSVVWEYKSKVSRDSDFDQLITHL